MKVIEAFSWANFILRTYFPLSIPKTPTEITKRFIVILSFVALLNLTLRVHARGDLGIWGASVSELPFFHEPIGANGYNNGYNGGGYPGVVGAGGQPPYGGYPNVRTYGPNEPIYQLPGHSVVLTTAADGTREGE